MVFHQRLEALLYNLRNGKYFKFTIDILTAKQYNPIDNKENDIYTGHYNDIKEYHGIGTLQQTIENLKVTYSGNWENGIRNGHGELSQPYNVKYTGEFRNNVPNGKGKLIIKKSIICTEECEIMNDVTEVLDGEYKMIITTTRNENLINVEEVYIGVWIDGLLFINEDGKQHRIQYDGVIYYGAMDNNKVANGEGQLLFPDGTKYEGIWTNNKIEKRNKVEYEMRVIEYQHRGLPHCHYVARLTEMPKAECMLIQWINENISTEGYSDFDNNNHAEYEIKEIIRNKMQHVCSQRTENNPRGCLNDNGLCSKFFHTTKQSNTAYFDGKGFPKYKRNQSDLKIVPYNKLISLDWGGHANCEFTEKTYCINYLYKYIFKGNGRITAQFTSFTYAEENEEEKDECTSFLKARKICSMDAMNRFLGNHTYPQPFPHVKVIKVKTQEQINLLLYENKLCDLFVYFNRPIALKNLKYVDFFKKYTYKRRNIDKNKGQWYTKKFVKEIVNPQTTKRRKVDLQATISLRTEKDKLICLQGLSLKCGEICYLRMLLKHRPAMSYDDLRTHNGIVYSTFQESAKQHGFLKDMEFLKEEFLSIFGRITSFSKRRLQYAIWLGQDYPVNFMYNNGIFCELTESDKDHPGYLYKEMVMDWIVKGYEKPEIKNMFLCEIDKYLKDNLGLNNTIFGLPQPTKINSEIDYEMVKYDKSSQLELYNTLEHDYPSNVLQAKFIDYFKCQFHKIQHKEDHEGIFMFLTGAGGTGKSNVLEKIAAYVRSEGSICKICAATALAASIYDDATTFHSLAKIPVVEQCDRELEYTINLNLTEDRLKLLLAAKVIIIDEIFFSHKECMEAFYYDERLNRLRGKIIIGAGDRRQFLPVAEGANKDAQISIALSSSELWKLFKKNIYELTENMRLIHTSNMSDMERTQQILYANILQDIGYQTSNHIDAFKNDLCTDDEQIYKFYCTNKFIVTNKSDTNTILDNSIKWLFENGFTHDAIKNSAVIVGTNILVDMWNKKIQQLNNNEEAVFLSHDYLADVDDDKGHLKELLTTKLLNSKNHSSAPPHELRLKIDDVCMLTR